MGRAMATLSLLPGQDHLEKVAKTSDPLRGLSEFVWNALDGDALNVSVVFEKNDLGGIHTIKIIDDGTGIRATALQQEYSQVTANLGKRTSTVRLSMGGQCMEKRAAEDSGSFHSRASPIGPQDILKTPSCNS